jgi:ribosomal subunit interface protein
MIKIQLTGRKYEIDKELKKYVNRKLGHLDRYLPRGHRSQGMSVEIFRDPSGREGNAYKVTVVLRVPGPDIVAETATINPHSAVDIVEQKLKMQIRKYKDKNQPKRLRIKELFNRDK